MVSFASIATAALTFASVANAIKLWAVDPSGHVDGQGLSSIHEGAGINYFFLGSDGEDLQFSNGVLSVQYTSNFLAQFSIQGHIVELGVAGSTPVSFSNNLLLVDGSADGFYAAKNTNDPYSYSSSSYQVVYYKDGGAPDGAIPIKIRKDGC